VIAWGADLRLTSDAALDQPAYQRVNTSTDYDTQNFIHYLKFDGTDDSLQTPSIDFSGVDKMTVWAGVTKLSDAATGIVCELGNGSDTNSFYLAAPGTAASNYQVEVEGTGGSTSRYAPYAAPISSLLTLLLSSVGSGASEMIVAHVDGSLVTPS